MTVTYAIADLHGRFDLLKACYDALKLRDPGLILHLGDYVDRGPSSAQIIRFLMDPDQILPGFTRKVLKGNHEDIMCQVVESPCAKIHWWLDNGGGATLISYGVPSGTKTTDPEGLMTIVPVEHYRWLKDLPTMHVDQHRVFVHAGVDPDATLEAQAEHTLLWMTYCPKNKWEQVGVDIGHGERHVVHGHHQFADGPKLLKNRTNLDVFAWREGRIVIGVFDDDKPGGPVEIIEVKA